MPSAPVTNATKELAETHDAPPCFQEPLDYALWKLYARRSRGLGPKSYCHDCTPEYQVSMLYRGRCAHPETRFYKFSKQLKTGEVEEEVIGLRVLLKQEKHFAEEIDA